MFSSPVRFLCLLRLWLVFWYTVLCQGVCGRVWGVHIWLCFWCLCIWLCFWCLCIWLCFWCLSLVFCWWGFLRICVWFLFFGYRFQLPTVVPLPRSLLTLRGHRGSFGLFTREDGGRRRERWAGGFCRLQFINSVRYRLPEMPRPMMYLDNPLSFRLSGCRQKPLVAGFRMLSFVLDVTSEPLTTRDLLAISEPTIFEPKFNALLKTTS